MPKAIDKYYAVAVGREGPKIYNTWEECKRQTHKYPAVFKSFLSLVQAEQWLASQISLHGRRSRSQGACPLQPEVSSTANDSSVNPVFLSADPSDPAPSSQTSLHVDSHSVTVAAELDSLENPRLKLSDEQEYVLDRVKSGHSVFFTGSAGTGKSVLLREIRDALVGQGLQGDRLGVTASTGMAAVNIGGRTLHSWAGIGLGDEDADRYIGKFFGNQQFKTILRRWQDVKTLIIDEVSMLDGSLFDKLETIARGVRKNSAPFGGIQLILSGDFCQLPPVPGRNKDGLPKPAVFAFDAVSWDACIGAPFVLTEVYRQKDDLVFIDILNAMRFGELDDKAICTLSALSREVTYVDGIEPTELFPTRHEVECANSFRLEQLESELHTFEAHDIPGYDFYWNHVSPLQMARLLERHSVVPQKIELKVGAKVMLLKNLVQGELVNGSTGQIVRFETAREALSRHTYIAGADKENGTQELPENSTAWPVVRFIGGQEVFIIPQKFTVNNARGVMEACREQVPLILSWALSVHKSQGKTLERVKVDLERTFEMGQAYVALSRATCMHQLQVLNFNVSKVTAHPRVIEWRRRTRSHPPEAFRPGVIDNWYYENDNADATLATDDIGLDPDNKVDEELAMASYYEP